MQDLFLCGGMGFLLAAYYDVFRLLRLLCRPKAMGIFAQDVLFCLSGSTAVFLFSLVVTDGILRAYLLVGLATGFLAYRYTVGRWVVPVVARVLHRIARCERWCLGQLKAVLAPIRNTLCIRWRKSMKKRKKGAGKGKKFQKTLETNEEYSV